MAIKATATATATLKSPKTDKTVKSPETVTVRGIGTGTAAATASAVTEIAAGIDIAAGAAHQTRRERPAATQAVTEAVGAEAGAEIAMTGTHAAIEMGTITVAVGIPADARALLEVVSIALETVTNAVSIATVAIRETMIEIDAVGGLLVPIETLETPHLLSSRRMREIAGQCSYNSLPRDSGQRSSRNSLKRLALFPKLKSSRTASATVPRGTYQSLGKT